MNLARSILKTTMFFTIVGSLIGSTIVLASLYIQEPFWISRGFLHTAAIFLTGYFLIGVPVSGLTGVLYAVTLYSIGHRSTSIFQRLISGLIAASTITAAWFIYVDFSQTNLTQVLATSSHIVPLIFNIVCVFGTICIQYLWERKHDSSSR